MIRFIDLFAGIGGFRLGLEKVGQLQQGVQRSRYCRNLEGNRGGSQYTCVWSCEIDRWCERVYRRNFGEGFDAHDIKAVDASLIPDHDLIAGGFPCQSFSIAGKGGGFSDTRGTLFFEICRIARAKRPPYLLLENVRNLLSVPYTQSAEEWTEADFDEAGEPTPRAEGKHKAIPGTKGWVFLTILDTLWQLGYDL